MKKHTFALCAALVASQVQAQSNITMYGVVDTYLASVNGGAGRTAKLETGGLSASRLGFSGIEDLGGGTRALFTVENGFNVDTGVLSQANAIFGRQAFVGLGGRFGTLTAGLQYEPLHLLHVQFSSHAVGFGDATASFISTVEDVRLPNSVKYLSPSFSGVTLQAFYALGENASVPTAGAPDKNFGDLLNLQANYDAGPLAGAVSAMRKKKTATLPDNITRSLTGALSYDFKVAKSYMVLARIRNDQGTALSPDIDFRSLALEVPLGLARINASVGDLRNRTMANAHARTVGLVVDYYLSKRSTVYAGYNRVANDGLAAYGVGAAGAQTVATTVSGFDPNAVVLGLRHRF